MPFPNFHTARQKDPDLFDPAYFRTKELAYGVEGVFGKKDGMAPMEIQTIRFDKTKFTPEQAKEWLDKAHYSAEQFEPAEYERVSMKSPDMAEIKDVEILDKGLWSGNKRQMVTTDDLDQMIANFKAGVVEPWLTLDHNDAYTDKVKSFLKVASLGWVSDLRRVGTKLVADFKQVPAKVAELIQSGTLKKRSVEFFPKGVPYRTNGKTYENVLTAVTFFGADKPAVNTLSDDFEVLMLAHGGKRTENEGAIVLQDKIQKEGNLAKTMFTKEHLEKVRGHLEAAKSCMEEHMQGEPTDGDKAQEGEEVSIAQKIAGLAKKLEDMHKDIQAIEGGDSAEGRPDDREEEGDGEGEEVKDKAKFKAMESELSELRKFKADSMIAAKQAEAKEAEDWIEAQIAEGKILPKAKQINLKNYMSAKASSADDLVAFKEDIANRPSAVDFSEVNNIEGATDKQNAKGKVSFKNDIELDAEIKRIMQVEKVDYIEATNILAARVNEPQE